MGSRMNLKQLEVFLAVAETGSFTRGAEKSFLTQSTVSQHISSLENEFGIPLLDRTSKGVMLTEAGSILFYHASKILAGTHELANAMQRFKGMEKVVLRIGASNIPGTYLIPLFLPLFQELHPGVTVDLTQGDSQQMLDKLKREEIELAIVGSLTEDNALDFHRVGSDNIILVVPPDHRWSGKGEISPEELLEESYLCREKGSGTAAAVHSALANAGINPKKLQIKAYLGSNEAIKQAISHGIGISFLSELSVRRECRQGELYPVAVRNLTICRNFYLASRRQRELSPAGSSFHRNIIEWYRESAPGLNPPCQL